MRIQRREVQLLVIGLALIGCLALIINYYNGFEADSFKMSKSSPISITWGKWKETQPWPKDAECSVHRTRIAVEGSLPTRALASYPGSGNTWSRFLIEGASGLYTGLRNSKGSNNTSISNGEVREWNDGTTLVQKTHLRTSHIFEDGYFNQHFYKAIGIYDNLLWRKDYINQFEGRAIVIVRNPFKCIISYWTFTRHGHTEKLDDKDSLLSKEFRYFALVGINRWLELITDWIDYGSEVYFLFYEDMVDNPIQEMRNLLEAVGIEPDEGRMKCLEKDHEGRFHRTTHVDSSNPYPVDHQHLFRNLIDIAASRLLAATGRTLPKHKYEYYTTEQI